MTEKKRKSKIAFIILPVTVIIIFSALPALLTLFSAGDFIITDKNSHYARAKKLFICGSRIICLKGEEESRSKLELSDPEETSYSLSLIPLGEIRLIEILPDDSNSDDTAGTVNRRYLGTYKIRLQGYTGILRLRQNKDRITGTVRFPDWANGKTEYLKYIRIRGKKIYFTRSANSDREIRRLGANSYFTQKFSGTYSSSGRYIKGFLINHRKERHQWDAER
ncbi:MAG TPA: hypothetical protein PK358_09615 [Spirochaetota bacterium]|nr:hypothetical protein [Spirochaetota bacterium]HPJ35079.1 hypothetical protein [Spirochaetota bacterium]